MKLLELVMQKHTITGLLFWGTGCLLFNDKWSSESMHLCQHISYTRTMQKMQIEP